MASITPSLFWVEGILREVGWLVGAMERGVGGQTWAHVEWSI